MKARGVFVSSLIILICALMFLNGCGKSDSSAPLSSEKAITAYSLNGVVGTINETEKTISVTKPFLTNISSLLATFSTTGVSIKIGTTSQLSGVTVNDFKAPVVYTVTAADGTTVNYTVTVTTGVWYNPTSLSDNISLDGEVAYFPRVAVDNNGNAIIVWYQCQPSTPPLAIEGPGKIFKSEYRNGAWTNPASLTDKINPDGSNAESPQVAMDNNGNAIIVWVQSDGANYQIFKSEYRNSTWTNPASLSDNISPDGQRAYSASVAMDDNGNAVIVWNQDAGIFKSEYRNGSWTHPASLSDNINPNGQFAFSPQVAMDNNGNAIIVWYQYNNTSHKIFKSEYRNGTWHHPSSLADNINPDGLYAYYPNVAMDNNGNAIIVWYQSDGTNNQISKSEYRNGTWHHPSSLVDNISPDGTDAGNPRVAMENNGNAIIVWFQSDGTNNQIFKSEYRNGIWTNPSSTADNISPDGQDAINVNVAMGSISNAIITWNQSDGINQQIFKSEYRNGAWKHPSSLADKISPDGPYAYAPNVVMDDNSNAIIVWQQLDGTYYQIFKSEYR